MTPDEFKLCCKTCGYAKKHIVDSYIKSHPKDEYTADDAMEVYRLQNSQDYKTMEERRYIHKWTTDDQ